MGPDDFDELVEEKTFTNGADKGAVKALFRKLRVAQLGGVSHLRFDGLKSPTVAEAKALGRCLHLCKHAQILDLQNGKMGDEAFGELCSAMTPESCFRLFFFPGNDLSHEGARHLARMLAVDKMPARLEYINLACNRLDDAAKQLLREAAGKRVRLVF